MMKNYFKYIVALSLGFLFFSIPFSVRLDFQKAEAQNTTCTFKGDSWYASSDSSNSTELTTGAVGSYNNLGLIVDSNNQPCVGKQVKFKILKDGVTAGNPGEVTKTTDSRGYIKTTNVNGQAGSSYRNCYDLGSGYVCGSTLAISGGNNNPNNPNVSNNTPQDSNSGGLTGDVPALGSGDCATLEQSIEFAAGGDSRFTDVLGIVPHFCTASSLMGFILNILFAFSGAVAVIFIIIGGYQYMTGMSSGGKEATGAGKKTITQAVIGLIVIIMASALVNIVLGLFTGSSGGTSNSGNNNSRGNPIVSKPTPSPSPSGSVNPPVDPVVQAASTIGWSWSLVSTTRGKAVKVSVSAPTSTLSTVCGNTGATVEASSNGKSASASFEKFSDQSTTQSANVTLDITPPADVTVTVCGEAIKNSTQYIN